MVPIAEFLAMQARAERAETQHAEVLALLHLANARIEDLTAQLARLTDRVTELAAAAARNKRPAKPPKPPKPPEPPKPPPDLADAQRKAFEERPQPPVLPPKPERQPTGARPKGRNPAPPHLPADETTSRPCACSRCGSARLDVVDTFNEEKLTVVKEHQRRRVVRRVTARCRDCGQRTTGDAPPAPYERSKITCEWLAWFIVQKFELLTPLDRLLRHLRLQGIPLSMGTAVRFTERAADLLAAIDGEHWRQLKASGLMYSDGTHLPVVVEGVPGTHRGYLEVYLGGSTEKTQPVLAKEGGGFLAAAFAAEDKARTPQLAGDALLAWRQSEIAPVYAAMRTWMEAVEPGLLPEDELAGTIRYYRNHWDALTRWVGYPMLPPDNSRSEREFQQVAKARHAWLHAGGTEGAHRAALLLGIVATAKNVGVDVEKYLCWAFERRGTWAGRYGLTPAQLTPAAYKRAIEGGPSG